MDSDSAVDSPVAEVRPWPRWQLFAFRYALLHYVLYAFPGPIRPLVQTVTGGLELAGLSTGKAPWSWLNAPFTWIDSGWQWLTTQMAALHVAPYEIIYQPTGSGDTGHDYAQLLIIFVVSWCGSLLWSLIGSARAYPRLGRWLHLVVRFDLAFTLFGYGFDKFYGGQFGQLSLSRLTQEIGDTWPMTMVGTFMQASKPYELFGGACEVLGGILLFHRRTALLGACISIGTMTNICALNWLYGVPVKQYSAHLLFFAIGLLAPFLPQLLAVFVQNRPSQPVDLRVVTGKRAAGVLLRLGIAWVAVFLIETHLQGMKPKPWLKDFTRSALYGLWTVESMALDGKEVPMTDATRWRDFAVDRGSTAWTRELTGKHHFFEFKSDEAAGTAQVKERGAVGDAATWRCERGSKVVKGDAPLLLHNEDRGKQVDVQRRSLVLKGKWDGHDLELHTVEKLFRLQTGFRLRQELPDFW
ncbi:MAG TPA: hypothetical protein VL361_11130 [Candidatus Limnocylindrales bacterium]|jgi:hypothetical protein|nr:hypothetical protein [Candidatus Limnocylindrales bacterium]